jgi:hypothetical protein
MIEVSALLEILIFTRKLLVLCCVGDSYTQIKQ